MKKKEWITPNRMKIETSHKGFNAQTNVISVGNVVANTQYSRYVRGYLNPGWGLVDYPDNIRKPGALQNFDLEPFYYLGLSTHIIRKVKEKLSGEDSGILYCFFHYSGEKRIVHGFILTDENHHLIDYWVTGKQYFKSLDVLLECKGYITEE